MKKPKKPVKNFLVEAESKVLSCKIIVPEKKVVAFLSRLNRDFLYLTKRHSMPDKLKVKTSIHNPEIF